MRIIKKTKNDIQELLKKISIDEKLWDQEMMYIGDSDNHVANPYGSAACMILQIYSMELGSPPFYAEFNKVCRNLDYKYLKQLGPFAKALFEICEGAEPNKKVEDRIPFG